MSNKEHSAPASHGGLGQAPLGALMLRMSVPGIAAQLINILYSIVDRIYIGHIPQVGAAALTGVGLTFPIITFISAFAMIAGAGGAPLAAIALGKNDRKQAQSILGTAVAMILPRFFGVMGVYWAEPVSDFLSVVTCVTLFLMNIRKILG